MSPAWIDISQAPKDGTKVDLFFPGSGRVTDCYFTTSGLIGWARTEWAGGRNSRHTVERRFMAKPTHFAHIPDEPVVEVERIDPSTGRLVGDHGTALDAIAFALDTSQGLECEDFLRAWREGDLAEYPDFYEWLAAREQKAAA